MNAAEIISVVSALAAVAAAVFSFWQARLSRRSASAALRSAEAAEAQADAALGQLELMRATHERDVAREAEAAEASRTAAVTIWKETRQPRGGSGAVVVVHNEGPAKAEELVVEVRATGNGGTIEVLGVDNHHIDTRPELRAGEHWQIPLMRNVGDREMPIEFSLRWRDGRDEAHSEVTRVEGIGRDQVD